jgi:phosphohistidine phosphatase
MNLKMGHTLPTEQVTNFNQAVFMLKLYLVRHAEAEQSAIDFERTLTPHGEEEALCMGRYLKSLDVQPDRILCSPAIRALTTAQIITQQLEYSANTVHTDPSLYNADLDTLLLTLGHLGKTPSVLLVAHNPGVTKLAAYLVDTLTPPLPTCALCMIELPADRWKSIAAHSGKMIEYTNPTLLSEPQSEHN